MAKTAKRVAKAPVRTVSDYIAPFAAKYGEGLNGIMVAQESQLAMLREALKDCPATNQEQFKTNVRKPLMVELMKLTRNGKPVYSSEASLLSFMSQAAVVWVGFTNNVAPLAGETTVSSYYAGAKGRLVSAGLYTPGKGAPKGGKGGAAKAATPTKAETTPGAAAGKGTTLTPAQILRAAFNALGRPVSDDKIALLSRVILQKNVEFWKKVETITTIS
jgi:hypothetical protein